MRSFQLTLQGSAVKAEGDIGVILCQCRDRLAQRFEMEELKDYLFAIDSVAFVDVVDDLCIDPVPLKKRRSKGLVIAGCSTRKHIDFLKDALERMKIPLFLCEFINLPGALAPDPTSVSKATEVTRLIIKAHIEKLHAAFQIAPRAKAAGVKEIMGTRKEKMTRRGFLRLPLMAAKIISHYEEFPLFDENRCIASKTSCRDCIHLCPFKALDIRRGKIHVREDKCEKCGLCATVCPLDAVQMPTFSASQALKLVDSLADFDLSVDNRSVIFTCDKGMEEMSRETEKARRETLNPIAVRVPCVACLSAVVLLRSLELGFEVVIPLCPEKACPKLTALELWRARMDSALRVVETSETGSRLVFIAHDKEKGSIFSQLQENLLKHRGTYALNPHPVRMSFHSRQDLLQILTSTVQNKSHQESFIEGLPLPYFDIQIDQQRCSFCGACVRYCPTGALVIDERSRPQIKYGAFDCVGCKKCVEICPEKAVTIQRVINPLQIRKGNFITKSSDDFARCRNCGKVIGKKSLLGGVGKKLKRSGFEKLSEHVYYCRPCRTSMAQQSEKVRRPPQSA